MNALGNSFTMSGAQSRFLSIATRLGRLGEGRAEPLGTIAGPARECLPADAVAGTSPPTRRAFAVSRTSSLSTPISLNCRDAWLPEDYPQVKRPNTGACAAGLLANPVVASPGGNRSDLFTEAKVSGCDQCLGPSLPRSSRGRGR